jgi:glycosyltransferase involved in cell wall biosynthesis
MNILFVGKRSRDSLSGIEKKMMSQIKAMESLGHHVHYTFFDGGQVYLSDTEGNEEVLVQYKENAISMYLANEKAIAEAVKRYPGYFGCFYMRKGMCSPVHLSNLRLLKKEKTEIIEEIPTYPYDDELKHSKGLGIKVFLLVDRMFRSQLKKYVRLFVTYSEDEEIFGVQAVPIQNGINVEKIEPRHAPALGKTLHLLTVSSMYFWHGYDRLIRGLAEYYRKQDADREVCLDMVGEGLCTEEWKKLTGELGMTDHVIFHGVKTGKELEEQYENAHIAVSSLGIHRLGLASSSTLKNREYMAKGIPMIVANHDKGVEKLGKYCLHVPEDESPIDIREVIRFAEGIKDYDQASKEMHAYAVENFSWNKQMKTVFDRL